MRKVIIAVSGRAGAGKDTFGKAVIDALNVKAVRMAFADHLKEQAKMLGWDGQKDQKGRSLLQHLGDVLREYHGADYFAEYLTNQVASSDAQVIVVTDLRYKKELEALQKLAERENDILVTVKIIRTEAYEMTAAQEKHSSENDLNGINMNVTIVNNGSMEELDTQVKAFIKENVAVYLGNA